MASTDDILKTGNIIADRLTEAENSLDPAERDMAVIRPHMMRGLARGLAGSLDPPWIDVDATNSSDPLAVKLGSGWFNKGAGWAVAASRKVPLLGKAELRGFVYSGGGTTPILTLPPLMLPAQNELFATVIDYQPAYINVWIDGTVSVWFAEVATRQTVTLSGISYKTAY